jgi:hypothetical protein
MRSRACCCFSHRAALITGSVLLALVLAMLAGCQGLPANVAKCSVTPTPPTNTSVVPPATEPPPAALCAFGVNDRNSEKQRQRSLPRPHRSERRGAGSDYTVRIYVDGAAVFYTPTSTINQYICMPNGQHTVEMVAEDVAGYIATSSIQLNVVAQDVGATDIQNRTNWVSCSALISGSTCAARVGVAQSSLALHQSHPIIGSIGFKVQPGRKTSLLE